LQQQYSINDSENSTITANANTQGLREVVSSVEVWSKTLSFPLMGCKRERNSQVEAASDEADSDKRRRRMECEIEGLCAHIYVHYGLRHHCCFLPWNLPSLPSLCNTHSHAHAKERRRRRALAFALVY
jgi:hypothetical protein